MSDDIRGYLVKPTKTVHSIAKMRPFLKKKNGETRYMEQKRNELEAKAQRILQPIIQKVQDDPKVKNKNSWISIVECYIDYNQYSMKIQVATLLEILFQYEDLKEMVKSQVHNIEYNIRREKQRFEYSKPIGIIFEDIPSVQTHDPKNKIDSDDLEFVVCVKSGVWRITSFFENSHFDVRSVDISRESCKELGIEHPAELYAVYH